MLNWRVKTVDKNSEFAERITHWKKFSNEYHKKFIDSKKECPEKIPDIIAEFCKKYRFAMDEPWVFNEIKRWMQDRNYKALEALTPNRGERTSAHEIETEGLMLVDDVEKIVSQGKTKTEAFKIIGGDGCESVKTRYYRARKRKPHVFFNKTDKEYVLKVGPTKISLGEKPIAYGFWEIRTPIEK